MTDLTNPIVWVHEEALGPANPALEDHPNAPALFVFDEQWIREQRISRKRLGFLYECCLELPVTIRKGNVVSEVINFARRHGADGIVSSGAVDPRLQRVAAEIDRELPLWILDGEPFVDLPKPPRLGRFSRYWRDAEPVVWTRY
jgi:hypothetical protein